MKQKVAIVALTLVLLLPLTVASPAAADMAGKALNTGSNLLFGWADCPKAWADEVVSKSHWLRSIAGLLVTGPVMCGVNVGARYLGVSADIVTLPFDGNILEPAVHETWHPPLRVKD